MIPTWAQLVYLICAICFILALKGLSGPKTARAGNLLGAAAAVVACALPFFYLEDLQNVGGFSGKGATLAELARLLDVARENIFAAGDHHNDVSMLDGRFAAMPSCPANAIAEVQLAVSNAGGYIAQKAHGAGVHEALVHFVNLDSVEALKS